MIYLKTKILTEQQAAQRYLIGKFTKQALKEKLNNY